MLLSIGLILILGYLGGLLFEKIKLPKIIGMLLVGIVIGPNLLNIVDDSLIEIFPYLRQISLVIILTRSGLSLDIKELKKIGRPAILMCIIPAIFEIAATTLLAPLLLNISTLEALLLGCVLAAVSPAIIVPRMIKLKEEGLGSIKKIPDIILAGSSADDILVIMLFYLSLTMQTGNIDVVKIVMFPVSIILGVLIGFIVGKIISLLINKFNLNNIISVVILLSTSFILIGLEDLVKSYIEFSSLLSIISLAMVIYSKSKAKSVEIKKSYQSLWVVFEIILFVIVGVSVDVSLALNYGLSAILLLMIILVIRSIGVYLCLLKTDLNFKERLFCIISYLPKATVQASIGGIALSSGLEVGNLILSLAVLSIIFTAPLGAILMDLTANKLLTKEEIIENNELN